VRIEVVVHPRASRERATWNGAVLELWTTQPPVDDAANAACLRMAAAWLGVPASRVRLASGRRSRRKLIEVDPEVPVPQPRPPSTTERGRPVARGGG